MNWHPKMVAVDIDGTLVDRQSGLPDSVRQAVSRVVASQTPVVLATGRSWPESKPVFDALKLPDGYCVVGNGTIWLEHAPTKIRRVHTFDPASVIERVLQLVPQARIAVEDVQGGFRLNRHFPEGDLRGSMKLQSVEELASTPVTRVIVRDPDASEADFVELADELGMHGVSYSVGWSAWLDITPEGVNKASGLAEIAQELDIDRKDVLVIGDGRNDIEMIEWAGRGVAMGDSSDEVKEAADAVTAPFDQDGAAIELNRWFTFGQQSNPQADHQPNKLGRRRTA